MNSKNNQAESTSGTYQNKNLGDPEFIITDPRIFEPNSDGSHIIMGVPRDFLFPRVQPPVTPQKSTVYIVDNK